MLMQADLPAPVVPATRMCGIFARGSAWIALPETSLPSHTVSGLEPSGGGAVDVAEGDHLALQVRDLDADRGLARDRGEDADLGRRQGVGQVVLHLADLAHLDAGGQLQLEAGDVRAADGPDDLRVDLEVGERLDQPAPDLRVAGGVRARIGGGGAGQQGGSGTVPVDRAVEVHHGLLPHGDGVEELRLGVVLPGRDDRGRLLLERLALGLHLAHERSVRGRFGLGDGGLERHRGVGVAEQVRVAERTVELTVERERVVLRGELLLGPRDPRLLGEHRLHDGLGGGLLASLRRRGLLVALVEPVLLRGPARHPGGCGSCPRRRVPRTVRGSQRSPP